MRAALAWPHFQRTTPETLLGYPGHPAGMEARVASRGPILSGWADFDALAPLVPGRVTLLEAVDDLGVALASALVADAARVGRVVRGSAGGLPPVLGGSAQPVGLLVLRGIPEDLASLRRLARRLDAPALVVVRRLPRGAALEADEVVRVWRDRGAAHLAFPRRGARFRSDAQATRKHRG